MQIRVGDEFTGLTISYGNGQEKAVTLVAERKTRNGKITCRHGHTKSVRENYPTRYLTSILTKSKEGKGEVLWQSE